MTNILNHASTELVAVPTPDDIVTAPPEFVAVVAPPLLLMYIHFLMTTTKILVMH